MSSVSISGLRADLSRYVRKAQNGEEIQILNRGNPVACLKPIKSVTEQIKDSELLDKMAKEGVLHRATVRAEYILERKPLDLGTSILDALLEERREGC